MGSQYEVIIVGAGSIGMAAGYYLAKQGIKILLVDAHDPPHSFGSHHGETRLIRHAYGESREYVPFALRSQLLWEQLQKESEETIFKQTGILGFGDPKSNSITEAIEGAKQYDLPMECLNACEINSRWKGVFVPFQYTGFFEPSSGILYSHNCIRTYRRLALRSEACLLSNTPVRDIEIDPKKVSVQTKVGTFTGDKLIVSAGAGSRNLLHCLDIDLPLQVTRQPIAWFESQAPVYESDMFPGFFADVPTGMYYGVPSLNGSGIKIGRHDFGRNLDPEQPNPPFGTNPEDENHLRDFLQTYMPQAAGRLRYGVTCMYTKTPDGNFIIDLHPKFKNVAIATGFSGHGFKFSSVVGEILSQLMTEKTSELDLSPFSLNRLGLDLKI